METPLVVIDFRDKSIYAVSNPSRDERVAQLLRDTRSTGNSASTTSTTSK